MNDLVIDKSRPPTKEWLTTECNSMGRHLFETFNDIDNRYDEFVYHIMNSKTWEELEEAKEGAYKYREYVWRTTGVPK